MFAPRILTPHHLTFLACVFLLGCSSSPTPIPSSTVTLRPTKAFVVDAQPLVAVPAYEVDLDGSWQFKIDRDESGQTQRWFDPTLDESDWMNVIVPHTWNVMPDYKPYAGLAWYRKKFTLPASAHDGHLRLHFDAVFYLARVWLNGKFLGEHEGGYTPFEFDVSDSVMGEGDNVLAVMVDNKRNLARIPATLSLSWSFDWWNYGGIVRDVSLNISSRGFIAAQKIVAEPHLIDVDRADTATITTTVTISNTATDPLNAMLQSDVIDDATGRSALSQAANSSLKIEAGQTANVEVKVNLVNPKLWHFDHPNLYRWSTVLQTQDGKTLHSDQTIFGIRKIELHDARLYLNGEPVRLAGLTRHEDSPEFGLAETTTIMSTDYDDLKRLNEVLSRPVHYPQHEFILDYADRHGILLIPEVPAWQLTAAQMDLPRMQALEKQQLCEMIEQDHNHPSVWAWSVANEIESDTPSGKDFVQMMIAYVKSLDATRPVGFASNLLNHRPEWDATALSDFVLMNQYFGTWVGPKDGLSDALDRIHRTWQQKTVIISEFGFEPRWQKLLERSESNLDPNHYYFIPSSLAPDSGAADAVRQQLIREQMEVFRSKPFIAGAIFWTYQDYRTPANFIMGVVDAQRKHRGSWEVLREEYSPVRIPSVQVTPAANARQAANILLQTRGPIDADMPAYTLRDYKLAWIVTTPAGDQTFSQGELTLPKLSPGSTWSGHIEWTVPESKYIIKLSIIRPTGFSVMESTINPLQ